MICYLYGYNLDLDLGIKTTQLRWKISSAVLVQAVRLEYHYDAEHVRIFILLLQLVGCSIF